MKPVNEMIHLDRHLYTLQVLSAHMKILLDAPEHLWRLIERKKYLPAAWLFLLARVVYQALVRNDDTDEQSWINEGIDVLVRVSFKFKHKLVRNLSRQNFPWFNANGRWYLNFGHRLSTNRRCH